MPDRDKQRARKEGGGEERCFSTVPRASPALVCVVVTA